MPTVASLVPISRPRGLLKATAIGMQTQVGYIYEEFPHPRGNCFSLQCGKKEYQVLNFNVENLKELLKQGVVTWPLRCVKADSRNCYIHDIRIPHHWYSDHICHVCTPLRLQSIQDQLRRFREFERGDRKKITDGPLRGSEIVSTKIEAKRRTLDTKFSGETAAHFVKPNRVIVTPKKAVTGDVHLRPAVIDVLVIAGRASVQTMTGWVTVHLPGKMPDPKIPSPIDATLVQITPDELQSLVSGAKLYLGVHAITLIPTPNPPSNIPPPR